MDFIIRASSSSLSIARATLVYRETKFHHHHHQKFRLQKRNQNKQTNKMPNKQSIPKNSIFIIDSNTHTHTRNLNIRIIIYYILHSLIWVLLSKKRMMLFIYVNQEKNQKQIWKYQNSHSLWFIIDGYALFKQTNRQTKRIARHVAFIFYFR